MMARPLEKQRSVRLLAIAIVAGFHALLLFALITVRATLDIMPTTAPILVQMLSDTTAKKEIVPDKPSLSNVKLANFDMPSFEIAASSNMPSESSSAAPSSSVTPDSNAVQHRMTPPDYQAAYLNNPAPAYPALARRAGEQGVVTLRVLVGVQGVATNIEIETSSRSRRLDQAAVAAVRLWRFIPAQQGDKPREAWVVIPITFTLDRAVS